MLPGLDFLSAQRSGLGAAEWRALEWPWTVKKGTTGTCFLPELLEPVAERREKRPGHVFCEKRPEFGFGTRQHKGPGVTTQKVIFVI